jgi:hypothetical protein
MRTTVVPAQITTIEDTIAANFTLTQILLLMTPVFWIALVYVLLPPQMGLVLYKLPLIVLVSLVCITLSIRIKQKLILDWLKVLFVYNARPKYFLFDKNDLYLREVVIPVVKPKPKVKPIPKAIQSIEKQSVATKELAYFDRLIASKRLNFKFRQGRKGGLNVVFEKK